MADESLADILSDEPPERPEAPTPPAERPEPSAAPDKPEPTGASSAKKEFRAKEWTAQGRDPETGHFLPKEPSAAPAPAAEPAAPAAPAAAAPAAPAPQQDMTDKERAFFRAAHEERTKRQALEQELAKLRAAPTQPPGEPVDPNAAFWQAPADALAKDRQQTRQEVHQAITQTRIGLTEQFARARYTDFDKAVEEFQQLAQVTPGLVEQMVAAADPAEFAYQTGKRHSQIKAYGSLDQWQATERGRIEAEVRAKVEAEFKAKEEEARRAREALPGSLSDARSTGGTHRAVWGGPPSLEDILK